MKGTVSEIEVRDAGAATREIRRLGPDVRAALIAADSAVFRESGPVELKELLEGARRSQIPLVLAVSGTGAIPIEIPASFHLCFIGEQLRIEDGDRSIAAADAAAAGIVNGAQEDGLVRTEALEVASRIADLAPLAVRACAVAVREGMRVGLETGLGIESEMFCRLFGTSDMKEGTRAFLEKRKPEFRGE
jgi:hypothetical protein